MPMFNPTLIGSPSPTGSNAASLQLLKRAFYKNSGTYSDTAPAGTKFVDVRAVGCGAYYVPDVVAGGGGGAYARDRLPCRSGQTISMNISGDFYASNQASAAATIVTVGSGQVVARNGSRDGVGGQASTCVGATRRSGGNGGTSGGTGLSGERGGAGGSGYNGSGGGGGSGGDIGDIDSLNIGGKGGSQTASRSIAAENGGGDSANAGPGVGLVYLEYWG